MMMEDKNMTINVNGGQVNIANDSSTMTVVQNNYNNVVNANELNDIIKGIMENVSGLSEKDADVIINAVDKAKEELSKPKPEVSRLRDCLTLISPMFTIANGIPTLVGNLQKLADYITPYIR